MATTCIPKPQSEYECVMLYHTVVERLHTIDPDIHDYLFEPNICDDGTIYEVVGLLTDYYREVRSKQLTLEREDASFWVVTLEDL